MPKPKPQDLEPIDPALPLVNRRHEIFAQEIAKGSSQSKAYVAAGYKADRPETTWSNASALIRNVKVVARVRWLSAKIAETTILTKSWLIQQAIGMLKESRDAGNFSAAARLAELLGREADNTFMPTSVVKHTGFMEMTADELREYIARETGALGGSGPSPEVEGRSGPPPDKLH